MKYFVYIGLFGALAFTSCRTNDTAQAREDRREENRKEEAKDKAENIGDEVEDVLD